MALLKVALSAWLMGTPVAPLAGTVEITVGFVLSAAAPVVKVQTKLLASAFPERSCAAVVIVAVNRVLAARAVVGVNVATEPETE
jgi:hypothetical protein